MYLFGYGYIISWTWFNYVKSKKKFFSFRTQKRNPVWLSVFEREQISYFAVLTSPTTYFPVFLFDQPVQEKSGSSSFMIFADLNLKNLLALKFG